MNIGAVRSHLILASFVVSIVAISFPSYANVITVCSSGCSFTSIQPAVDSANSFDEVRITDSRSYNENITINRDAINLTSNSSARPTIWASGIYPTIKATVLAHGPWIRNLVVVYNGSTNGINTVNISSSLGNFLLSGDSIINNGTGLNNSALLIVGSNGIISNNTITTDGLNRSIGIFSAMNQLITIKNNTISTNGSGSDNYGIYLYYYGISGSYGNTIINNTIYTNGTKNNNGLEINQDNNFLVNDTINVGGSGLSYGVHIQGSVNNTLSSSTIKTNSTFKNNYGLVFEGASGNNTIIDSAITSPNSFSCCQDNFTFDIFSIGGPVTKNYIINSTLNNTSIGFSADSLGNIYVQHRMNINVVDNYGNPVNGSTVSGIDAGNGNYLTSANPSGSFSFDTNSSGYIQQQNITEFLANLTNNASSSGSGYLYFNNYTITANKSQYTTNSTTLNATGDTVLSLNIAPQAPSYYGDSESIPNNTVYAFLSSYSFQIGWIDPVNITTVTFEANFPTAQNPNGTLKNYSTSQSGPSYNGSYSTSFFDLGAGSYQYRWYANDSYNRTNSTNVTVYNVSKAASTVSLLINESSNFTFNLNDFAEFEFGINVNGTIFPLSPINVILQSNMTGFTDQNVSATNLQRTFTNTTQMVVSGKSFNVTAVFYGDANHTGSYNTSFFDVNVPAQEPTSSSSPSGGGGGIGQITPPTTSQDVVADIYLQRLEEGKSNYLDFSRSGTPVEKITIGVRDTLSSVKVSVKNIEPDSIIVKPNGNILSYFEVDKQNISDSDIESANIEFNVNKSWISQQNTTPGSVSLYRYSGGWNRLNTTLISENGSQYKYESATPGFSTFAIVAETSQPYVPSKSNETSQTTIPEASPNYYEWIAIAAAVAFIVGIFAGRGRFSTSGKAKSSRRRN